MSLAAGLLAAALAAAPAPQPYLAAPLEISDSLGAPPAPDSAAGAADAAAVRARRALKDGPRWLLAAEEDEVTAASPYEVFACALGARIAPASAPNLTGLFARLERDVSPAVGAAKRRFSRARPFADEAEPVCVAVDRQRSSSSYPSTHGALGWAWALVLAELAPDRAAPLLARGRAYGDNRVVCGAHFPSDIEAGRTAGAAVLAALHGSPQFRADLDKARAEVAAARAAATPDAGQCEAEAEALRTSWRP